MGHRDATDEDHAPAQPSSALFQRRLRKGIAPLNLEVVRPFKPRTDGKLCVLDAPATHIRLGASIAPNGAKMLTCIDIHTYEYFLMREDGPADPQPAREAGMGSQDNGHARGSPQGAAAQRGGSGLSSANTAEAAAVLADMDGIEREEDRVACWGLGSIMSPCSLRSGSSSPLLSPFLESDGLSPAEELPPAAVPAPPAAADVLQRDREAALATELGCKRGLGCVIVSDAVVSPLTPCNVDAGTNLWMPRQPRAVEVQGRSVSSIADVTEKFFGKRRKML
mmetsp:Transcript_11903/g.29157  ORF Transcript_11903/g.29157 Transcript_11903/m.29157 type:complete len:280 (+) Transcript_11903:201-1040(+)